MVIPSQISNGSSTESNWKVARVNLYSKVCDSGHFLRLLPENNINRENKSLHVLNCGMCTIGKIEQHYAFKVSIDFYHVVTLH